jgi:hypothetical protein
MSANLATAIHQRVPPTFSETDEQRIIAGIVYEKFRPSIPEGVTGWGAKGELDLDYIRSLASKLK